jgi:hypothetical protein
VASISCCPSSRQPEQLTIQARVNSPQAGALLKVALGHDFTTTVKLAKAGINEIRLSLPGESLTSTPSVPTSGALRPDTAQCPVGALDRRPIRRILQYAVL